MTIVRHFTATGFVVHECHLALHWHRKVKAWLPPGGHIEDNEDPIQAVVREVREESGLLAKVVRTKPFFNIAYPAQLDVPITIMIEDIDDPIAGLHQHIDMIYMLQLAKPRKSLKKGWKWVSQQQLANSVPLEYEPGLVAVPPEDVRVLAAHIFKAIANLSG